MAKSRTETANAAEKKPRKKRGSGAKYFIATVHGTPEPMILVAATQKAALAKLITLRAATPGDLFEAGKKGYREIDVMPAAPTAAQSDAAMAAEAA